MSLIKLKLVKIKKKSGISLYVSKNFHLFYTFFLFLQYKNRVKDLGSFRLTVGNPHFHGLCNFAEFILETVK